MFLFAILASLLALANTRVQGARPPGAEVRTVTTCKFDSSYPEGGEGLTPEALGLRRVEFAICTVVGVAKEANVANAAYDVENEKLQLFNETPAEVANEADVEGVEVQVVAYGT